MNYDVSIIGGGLSGLALSILLRRSGYRTIVFEKEAYPFHRVCGEYISMESKDFLEGLGLPIHSLNLPFINRLQLSAISGKQIMLPLNPGGFGISRYLLDDSLARIARREGVEIREKTKVKDIKFQDDLFNVEYSGGSVQSTVSVAAMGKRSNLDIKWDRMFSRKKAGKFNNYLGIKYHIKTDHPEDLIALHNFDHGYCGISRVENDISCLCYLTTAENLKKYAGNIHDMEEGSLMKNPLLKNIFKKAKFLFPEPLTISQISFEAKSTIENHVMMAGDAAGLIAPLCGNGMSMAFESGKIIFEEIHSFLRKESPRQVMEQNYQRRWKKHFSSRLKTGKIIQSLFIKPRNTALFFSLIRPFPLILRGIIKNTHGKPF